MAEIKDQYFDIGVNLAGKGFIGKVDNTVQESHRNGVKYLICISNNMKEAWRTSNLVKTHPGVYGTAGIHPHRADQFNDNTLKDLRTILKNPKIVAIGECGLDYNRMFSPKEIQIKCFEEHLKLAIELGKPVYLHERDAHDDLYKILEKHMPNLRGAVIHCFTGTSEAVQKYVKLGCYIGTTGWITDPKRGEGLRQAIKHIPLDRLMVETDAPWLTPFVNGQRVDRTSKPAHVKHVCRKVAELLGQDEELIVNTTYNNAIRFFCIE